MTEFAKDYVSVNPGDGDCLGPPMPDDDIELFCAKCECYVTTIHKSQAQNDLVGLSLNIHCEACALEGESEEGDGDDTGPGQRGE